MFSKELSFNSFLTLGGCSGLQRTESQQFLGGCSSLQRTDLVTVSSLGRCGVSKELILTVSILGGCRGLQRTDMSQQFLLWAGCGSLHQGTQFLTVSILAGCGSLSKELIFNSFFLGGCGGLQRTDL